MFKPHRIFLTLLILLMSVNLAYSAPARSGLPAGVQSFAPTGTVPENVSFRIVFRNPVVNRNQAGKLITPENNLFPFEVNPPLQLEGRWQNERTFTARLLAPLKGATTYTATLRDNLRDRRGNNIGPGSFRFQTEGLSPTDIQASMGKDGNAYFTLNFNMRIDPARLKGFMRIKNSAGRELAYNINGALPSRTIRVAVPVEKTSSRQKFTVTIAAGLKSGEGDMGIDRDISEVVILDPVLTVQNLRPDNENSIRASFNFGVDVKTAKNYIKIDPPVSDLDFESGWSDEYFIINSKEFKPRSRFVITFKKGFPSKGGLVLKEDFRQAIIMPDLESRISLPASGTYLTALENSLIPIELRNVKKLQLDLWRMYENNIPYVVGKEYDNFERDIARRVFTKEIPLDLPLNEQVRRSIPVQEMVNGERGLFMLTARDSSKGWWDEETQVINLSDMAATARLWEDSILIWVNTLTTARGIQDAEVKIFSDKKQLLAQGKTNNGGVFFYELPNKATWDSDNQPSLAIVSKTQNGQTDLTYVQLTRNLLDREIFDTSGRDWLRKGYDAVIFSPRDIYRTGELVNFKSIVRNADISTPESFPVLFIVRDTLGRKVKQETLTLSDKGSAVTNLQLPSNALTGLWTASITIPGQESKPLAAYNFHVEDFAPPRLEVKMNTYKKYLLHNDKFTADVYARWLFGVDGAGLNYKVSWTAREGKFTPTQDRWKAYNFGDPSRRFAPEEDTIGEGQLDNFGKLEASLTLDADWEAPTLINVTMKAEIMEDGGRWVSSTITRPYYPAPWLLGIAPVKESFTAREDAKFRVAAINPEEEPADPGELKAELYKITWDYNIVEIDGRKRWQSTEEINQVAEKNITLKNGVAEFAFKPESYGSYMVKISDGDDIARAVYRFYASSSQSAGGGSQLIDRIEIKPEKDSYKLGENAVVNVKVPFEGLLMLTLENSNLITRKIQRVDESEVKFDFKIEQNMRPNVWVTAWLVRPVKQEDSKGWATHRAIGLARVKVDISDYNIAVNIDAPDKIEPASKLPVKLTLKSNSQSITNNADVSIALVDDGVLGLTRYKTPDLLNYFWGLKKLNSQGFDIYDQIIPVEDQATEQLHPAGDEGLAALAGDSNVQRFKILSLFEGTLTPDKNGVITTELDIPEFSGRGRLCVVAASGKNFGNAEKNIQIAREIVTETGLPRFAAPDDSFTIPTVVFNTSGQNRSVKITLVPEGLSLKETFADLNISAGGNASFNTTAKALGGSDRAALKIITSWNENGKQREFTQEIEMPIRSAWPVVTMGGSGIFEEGRTRLELPLNDFAGKITGSLTLADTPAVSLNQAVNFLRNYPYGCLEQTISGAWPFLILPDALAEIDPDTINDEAIKSRVDNAIIRIQSMQLYDGSFAMWPGSSTPFNWGSVYAAHFLLEAKKKGINFPEEMFTGVINWMRQYLPSMPAYDSNDDERDDLTTKAYAVYVLTLNGEKPLGWIEYLRENHRRLRPSGHVYLAGAQALIDGNSDSLKNLQLGTVKSSGGTLESDARNTALLLSMWLDVEPRAPEVTELASRLLNLGSNGGWYSTQDNSASLIALARYNVEAVSAKSDITAHVNTETNDSAILEFANHKAASIKISELPKDSAILIEGKGTGQGCYSWSATGYTKSQPKPERKNINIECVYFDEKGNILNPSQPINHGTIVQAVLTIRPSMTVNNLALSYLLPAGFELENPRLDDGETNSGYGVVSDIRDDRLVLFFNRVKGERSYGFKMRAVTRGTFKVPQISAFGMYDSSVRFTGSAQPDIVIK